MKSVINRVIVSIALVALVGATALAKTNMRTVSISSDIKVNGTIVKKGEYGVRFDEKSGELSFEKDGKVVAKTMARLENRNRKAAGTEVQTILEGMDQRLVGIAFRGSDQNSNPCKRVRKEKEGGKRERYLTFDEESRLMEALTGDLDYLRPAVIVSVGTGLRKSELLRIEVDHVNFGNASKFHAVNGRDVEIHPNWLLVVKSKNRKPRIIPMNSMVRGALSGAIQDSSGSELVFSQARGGIDSETIRSGFASACKKAEITCGQTKAGGITWHDLRHTFATRLRGERVHELDIMELLGHSSVGVTAGYAHGTPAVIQSAVDKLAEPRGEVVEFARRVG